MSTMKPSASDQMTTAARQAILAKGLVHIASAWSTDYKSISVDVIRKWMQSGTIPKIDSVLKMARIVGIPPHEIRPDVYVDYRYSPTTTTERKRR